jgi:hypothetical protein
MGQFMQRILVAAGGMRQYQVFGNAKPLVMLLE